MISEFSSQLSAAEIAQTEASLQAKTHLMWQAEMDLMQIQDEHVVLQYRAVAGVFEIFWREVGVRTDKALWRLDGPYKGSGSCRNVDHELAGDLIGGIGSSLLFAQRDWKNFQTEGAQKNCPFFRVDQGCVLGNLKSPRCLDHVDYEQGKEIENKFGFKVPDMRAPLERIQLGGMTREEMESGIYEVKPNVNDDFVMSTIDEWMERVEYVKTFPVLHPEEAAQIDYAQILDLTPIPDPRLSPDYRPFRRIRTSQTIEVAPGLEA